MQRKVKAVIDKLLALLALVVLSPIMLIAAVGIRISSEGPILYKAKRMGRNMSPLIIYKFRTMKVGADREGSITGLNDGRVFAWGEILRKTKVDELPQLLNILNGTMAVIGPRPEDIDIVNRYYNEQEKETLAVLPGLACPGSIFNYTHGDKFLIGENTEELYVKEFLHIKLALDIYYLKHWSLVYDFSIIVRTIYVIFVSTFSNKQLPYPKEYKEVYGEGNKGV